MASTVFFLLNSKAYYLAEVDCLMVTGGYNINVIMQILSNPQKVIFRVNYTKIRRKHYAFLYIKNYEFEVIGDWIILHNIFIIIHNVSVLSFLFFYYKFTRAKSLKLMFFKRFDYYCLLSFACFCICYCVQ